MFISHLRGTFLSDYTMETFCCCREERSINILYKATSMHPLDLNRAFCVISISSKFFYKVNHTDILLCRIFIIFLPFVVSFDVTPLCSNIKIQSLCIIFFKFAIVLTSRICQDLLQSVIIFFILITLMFHIGVMWLGEIRCQSLFGVKGSKCALCDNLLIWNMCLYFEGKKKNF